MANIIVGTKPNQVPTNAHLGELAYLSLAQINLGFMHVRGQFAANTPGGTSTGGAFNTRTLNTVVTNTIPGATLGSNIVTLLPGTYYIEAEAPETGSNGTKLSLYNNTDSVDLLVGISQGAGSGILARCTGQITLAATKGIIMRQWFNSGVATNGLGSPVNSGQAEVYASMKIWKIA